MHAHTLTVTPAHTRVRVFLCSGPGEQWRVTFAEPLPRAGRRVRASPVSSSSPGGRPFSAAASRCGAAGGACPTASGAPCWEERFPRVRSDRPVSRVEGKRSEDACPHAARCATPRLEGGKSAVAHKCRPVTDAPLSVCLSVCLRRGPGLRAGVTCPQSHGGEGSRGAAAPSRPLVHLQLDVPREDGLVVGDAREGRRCALSAQGSGLQGR